MTPLERHVLVRAAEHPGGRLILVAHDREERAALVRLIRVGLVRVAGDSLRIVGASLDAAESGGAHPPTYVDKADLPPPDPRAERTKAAMVAHVPANPGVTRTTVSKLPGTSDRPGFLDELVLSGRIHERESDDPGALTAYWPPAR